ncbi:MAG: hypothetical protein ACI82F_001785, partial [Planctomycetota bacterium]
RRGQKGTEGDRRGQKGTEGDRRGQKGTERPGRRGHEGTERPWVGHRGTDYLSRHDDGAVWGDRPRRVKPRSGSGGVSASHDDPRLGHGMGALLGTRRCHGVSGASAEFLHPTSCANMGSSVPSNAPSWSACLGCASVHAYPPSLSQASHETLEHFVHASSIWALCPLDRLACDVVRFVRRVGGCGRAVA